MLNLSSLFSGKGIELRLFNGSLHAGEVKAYIQFSLALCQSAKDLTRVSSYVPKNGTLISVRGLGRFIYDGILRQTKKGRNVISVRIY